jgi:endo-1,3-1,4-beta-glycanase ExoK
MSEFIETAIARIEAAEAWANARAAGLGRHVSALAAGASGRAAALSAKVGALGARLGQQAVAGFRRTGLQRLSPVEAGVVASFVTLAAVALFFTGLGLAPRPQAETPAVIETPAPEIAPDEPVGTPLVPWDANPQPLDEAPEADAGAVASRGPQGPLGEAFVDRFDGGVLDARWVASDGWSNGEWTDNDWRKEQVRVTDAGLEIVMERSPPGRDKAFASGEIQSRDSYRYGYFETRMKMPKARGTTVAAFTYAPAEGREKPHEIDIELIGDDTRRIELTYHVNGRPTHAKVDLPFDASAGFHTYGFDWQPDHVRWYVDGRMVHEVTGGGVGRLTKPQKFIFMLWGSRKLHQWLGRLDMDGGPWTYTIACAAYQPAYTGRSPCADATQAPAGERAEVSDLGLRPAQSF